MKSGMQILLILALSLLGQAVMARDFDNGYAVYGAGAQPCSTYIKARNKGGAEDDFFNDWMIGYLSAFNLIMPKTYDILGESDFPTVQRWMEDHCRKYPREIFINAMAKLTEVLYPGRYQAGLKNTATKQSPAKPVPKPPTRSLKDIKIR